MLVRRMRSEAANMGDGCQDLSKTSVLSSTIFSKLEESQAFSMATAAGLLKAVSR